LVVGESIEVILTKFGSISSFGLPFCKALSDNTQTSSSFGLLSCSKAQKSISLGASPTKYTIARSPFHMQVKILDEEKEVNSLITSKCKRKLLKEHKVVNDQQESLESMNGQQDGVKDLLDVVKLLELGIGCIWL
jgi:hypothetical protein